MKHTLSPWSIVIPTYNGQSLLEKHFPAVISQLESGDQLVIADDASTDSTIQWLRQQKDILAKQGIRLPVVTQKKNQRFAATANHGIQAAIHPYVWLLNNDVSPLTPNAKARLLRWFMYPEVFSVGCAEVTDLRPQASISGRGTGGWKRGLLQHWYDPDQQHFSTLWTAGGSMIVDRQKFLDLGGFDELFAPAYEEDRDLSYRAVKHGWQVIFDYTVQVLHQHESTNRSAFGTKSIASMSWKNQFILVWKNITSTRLLLDHLLWLPYHLTVSQLRTGGAVGQGFWQALQQLPAIRRSRRNFRSSWLRNDYEVLTQAQTELPEPSLLRCQNSH